MISFIITLFILLISLILCIFWTVKLYKRDKKYGKENNQIRENKKIIFIGRRIKKENRLLLLSFVGTVISVIGTLYTLFNSVPAPTIYPLDNEARVYSGEAKVIISTIDFPFFNTYYSLDGSDPENGYIYEDTFTVTKTTTVSAKNRFLIFWSKLSQSTFRFENAQNITVISADDEHTSIQDIFTYALVFLFLCAIFIPVIRGDK